MTGTQSIKKRLLNKAIIQEDIVVKVTLFQAEDDSDDNHGVS